MATDGLYVALDPGGPTSSAGDRRATRDSACRATCVKQGRMSDLRSSAARQPAIGPPASPSSTAQFGVIVFLASDVMLFAPFFAAYFLLRANNQPWPPEGVELDVSRAFGATLAPGRLVVHAGRRPTGPANGRWAGAACAAGCS